MARVTLKHMKKAYEDGFVAVKDFSMEIGDKEFIVFVGPSGCGKSTTLRMIAGLETITEGELSIDGVVVNHLEPKDRNIAMVFQNYALYPHMTVYENMAFSLKIRHMKKEEIDKKVKEAARVLGITPYLYKKPKALSGGQRQRVALGRAIVRDPKVFLLDEPLSNLDAKLRSTMRFEITKLYERLSATFIYVTHDQVEAMTMGTRIVVMREGEIQQIDTPMGLYHRPANLFVAGFIGTPGMNFFWGTLHRQQNTLCFLTENGVNIPLETAGESALSIYEKEKKPLILGIRPDGIVLTPGDGKTGVSAVVTMVEALGGETLVYLNLNRSDPEDTATGLIVKLTSPLEVLRGDTVSLTFRGEHLYFFDGESEQTVAFPKG